MAVRIPINLASEPFRRDRPVIVGAAVLSTLLVFALVVQTFVILNERSQAADTRLLLDRLNAQVARLNADQAKFDATLRQPQNSEVLERSLFLNLIIQHKAISWTKLFSDLSSVMPHDVRLVTVRLPQVDAENHVWLDMIVAAKEYAPIGELLNKLEAAPEFGALSVLSSTPPSQTDPYVHYRVSVSYAQKL